jgi:hypothetical protein
MRKCWLELLLLALLAPLSTFLVWLPFAIGQTGSMLTVFANYDGPNYLVIAKTLYNKAQIASAFSLPVPLEYYPAHLPAYPILIKIFSLFLPGTWAMLISTVVPTILAVIIFYLLLKKFHLTADPFWLSLLFLFLPARWLAVRSVGSPEPLFIFAILASLYFFKSNNFFLAGVFGALAQITKTPGILLFIAYCLFLIFKFKETKKFELRAWPLLLIPLSLFFVFLFYQKQTGDFFAYFHSGDNFHLVFPPYQSFISSRSWLGQIWVEDMIWQYLIGALAVIYLIKQRYYDLASFAGIFFTATLFIAHRDLARYSLPLMPFALIAFEKFLATRAFKIAFFIVLSAIYLYAINFIAGTTAPVADWTPYL